MTVIASSHSSSPLLRGLLFGDARRGVVMGPNELRFGDYVVRLTALGRPRMPNGIECDVTAASRLRVSIGRGHLVVGDVKLEPGREWDPVPVFPRIHGWPPGPEPQATHLSGWPGAPSEANNAMLMGYVAGLVLVHARRLRAARIAERTATRTDPSSATLLRHAVRGEVPEPVHTLLATGDPHPLLAMGAAGTWWLRGLVSAGLPFDGALSLMRDVRAVSAADVR